MKGKDKCKILKEIRAQIAAANEIEWVTDNCSHKGECRGTCPKCEAEVAALEKALARRRALGKTVAVAGLSAGIVVSSAMTSSCALRPGQTTDGDMVAPNERVENNAGKGAPDGIESERTDTTTSSTVPLTGEVETEIAIDGDMIMPVYYTDFTLTEARTFEIKSECYAYGVITEEDETYADGVTLPVGAQVELLGENSMGGEALIRYEGKYYYLYAGEIEEFAHEVTD